MEEFYRKRGLKLYTRPVCLGWKCIVDYLSGKRTPARILEDAFLKEIMPSLKGKVVELGAMPISGYKNLATSADEYIVTNIHKDKEWCTYLDATKMDLPNNSVDGIICANMLGQIPDPKKVISEIRRVLCIGGTAVIVAPFFYYFTEAPDDYYRFSPSVLLRYFSDFQIIRCETLCNYWSTMAALVQNPKFLGEPRPWDFLARFIGLFLLLLSRTRRHQDRFFMICCLVAEKKNP
ncbi:MAG: methyltransferase domain-containing protein [Candidatus Omnitrophota bacterium]